MTIYIKKSAIQFKNPMVGQPTRSVVEHYNGRRITADVDGKEETIKFLPGELTFEATEEEMIKAIETKLSAQ